MARKVSVGLEADVAGFIGPVDAAAHATEKLDDHVNELDRSLDKIPGDAMRAGAAMKLLSGDVGNVKSNIDQLGRGSGAMGLLDQRIKNTRTEIKKLTTEFEKTGDVDIFRRLGQSHANLGALTKIRHEIADDIEKGGIDGVSKIGDAILKMLPEPIAQALSSPVGIAAAGAFALLFGSMLGAAIGGAIIAGGAVSAVALGVAGAAAADPKRVGAAWSAEIARIKGDWIAASSSFVGPTIAAIHTLGSAVDSIHLDRILSKAAAFVGPLAQGAAGFAQYIGKGVEELVAKAGPIVDVLKSELPEVGHAIEMSLSMIAGGNKGAAEGLTTVLHAVESIIVAVGATIRFFEDLWHVINLVGDAIRTVTDKIPFAGLMTGIFDPKQPKAFAVSLDGAAHGLDKTAQAAAAAGPSLSDLNTLLSRTAVTADTLAGGIVDKLIGSMLSLDNANISVADSLDKVTQSFKTNGKALDIHTAKGRANRTSVLGAVQANLQLYDAQISAGMSAQDAAAAYDVNTAALERQLRKAGLTKAQIDGLIGKYRSVPKNVNTLIALQGLTDAINGLADLIRLINHIPSNKIVHVTTVFSSTGQMKSGQSRNPGGGLALGGIRHAALGMIVAPSNPGTLIAEPQTGGEALIPLQGLTQHAAMGLMRTAGAGYGLDVMPRGGGGAMRFEHTLTVVDGSAGRSGLASLIASLAFTGELQMTSRAIVN